MTVDSPTTVIAAFEQVLEEVEDEIEHVNQQGGQAFAVGKYDDVDAARQQVDRLTAYRRRIAALRDEWEALFAAYRSGEEEESAGGRRDLGRLKRGVRTPEDAYRLPILRALVALGGSGRVPEVLARVEAEMKGQLSAADLEPLPSNPNSTRWYNAAQWCRNSMVHEGLLADDSPRGTWEITEAGRSHLR